jgi:hypothetical protein
MLELISFWKLPISVPEKSFRIFYLALFGTTVLAYINSIFPFLPDTLLGFNWAGIAWILALLVSLTVLLNAKKSVFPIWFWIPWLAYIFVYVFYDFSFIGFQLTLQYALPILMGYLAATFNYSWSNMLWLFQRLIKTTGLIFMLFVGYQSLYGYMPHMAATPMFFLILASLSLGLFFFTKQKKYLLLFLLLFLMPFLNVTRMALLVFGLTFILHFANKGIGSKVLGSFAGGVLLLFVLTSTGFQEKTFYDGEGSLSNISFDYYDNEEINSSGRKSWQIALEPGLNAAPIWGNGPRSDASILGAVMGKETGEAHNDYMSVRYNYGYVGLGLLLVGFAASFLRLWVISKKYNDPVFQLLVLTNLTLFIGFLMFMYSDNILKYTIWFPNYFFVMMGICFSMYKKGFSYQ